jgi:hypothetical protein
MMMNEAKPDYAILKANNRVFLGTLIKNMVEPIN